MRLFDIVFWELFPLYVAIFCAKPRRKRTSLHTGETIGAMAPEKPLTLLSKGYTRKGNKGAKCFSWNSKNNILENRWLYTDRSLTWTLSPVSRKDNAVYLNTLENGEQIIIGKDWDSGKQVAEIRLAKTYKVNTCGQFIYPLRNGDLVVSGAFGQVLIRKNK